MFMGHHINNLKDQQKYEKSDHCKVSKNAQSASKSLHKSRAKLKEKTYIQNVETRRPHAFVENNQSEMSDRVCPEGTFRAFTSNSVNTLFFFFLKFKT